MTTMTTIPTPYEDLLADVLANGKVRADRTGTGTIGVFGRQIRYDLADGFPLVTTKKVFTRGVFAELLWFLAGDTNEHSLRDQGVNIWREWAGGDGELGPIYSASWRSVFASSQDVVQIPVRRDRDAGFKYPYIADRLDSIDCDLNTQEIWAVEDLGAPGGNRRYRVQLASGFITEISRPNWRALESTQIIDGYAKTTCGVGFRGSLEYQVPKRTYHLWRNMLSRCYDTNHPMYPVYGGKGVTVSPIWHSLEYFARTLNRVPGYHKWSRGEPLELDKDYFGSGVYSPSTCHFLTHEVNAGMRQDGAALVVGGEKHLSYKEWGRRNGTDAWYAKSRWDAGLPYKDIPAEAVSLLPSDEGMLWRRRSSYDQITEVIESIRDNPFSRRHIVSAWNVEEVPHMALPPCHTLFQFHVDPDEHGNPERLNLQLYQRSADLFLGVPFNIASYAALLMMVAQQVGLKAGEFVHTFGDAHIYLNHVDQVKEQLAREARPYPTLTIAERPSLFEHQLEDFLITGYDPHPAIKGAVSV